MHIKIPYASKEKISEALIKKKYTIEANFFSQRYVSGRKDAIFVEIKSKITIKFVQVLQVICRELDLKGAVSQCTQIINMIENSDNQIIVSMRALEQGLIEYIKQDALDGWIYQENKDGSMTPYLVESVKYTPPNADRNILECITLNLLSNAPHKSKSKQRKIVVYQMIQAQKKTIVGILAKRGLYKESIELKKTYELSISSYQTAQSKYGQQFQSSGTAILINEKSNKEEQVISLGNNNFPRKLINDEEILSREYEMYSDAEFWQEHHIKPGQFEEVPFEPYLHMFDLESHQNIWIHASEIQEYKYDKSLKDKLILPEDHRDLIELLVDDMDIVMDDFIKGKSGGTIILCMGGSGLGKTLTAEIYAELIGRPLYEVNSGQLGTDPVQIEERLNTILRRTERWGAIALLDEADVYIRERDNSMRHNAIVTVFLRKLEYFNGLLFMTTNRYDDVDDAIRSRCSVTLRYETPNVEESALLWRYLAKQFKLRMTKTLIDKLVKTYPDTPGRDIKKLLILASKYQRIKGTSVNAELFRKCAIFTGIKMK